MAFALSVGEGVLTYQDRKGEGVTAFEFPQSVCVGADGKRQGRCLRVGVYLIEKPSTIALIKNARKPPRLLLEGLDVLDLDHEHVTRLGCLDLEGTGKVVDLGQVNVLHIIGAVVILDLPARPVDTLDLDDLAVLDGAVEGHCGSESIA